MNPIVDFVFKRIFGTEENKDLLLSFLNATLKPEEGKQLQEITLVDPHINADQVGDKASILDVRGKTKTGEQINIEVQLHNKYDMEKRSLYYWAKMYEGQLAEGEPYRNLKKTVTISIVDFSYLHSKSYHSVFRLREDTESFVLTDNLEIHFLELPKLGFEHQETSDLLVKWLLFLKAESQTKLEELAMSEPTIRKAVNVLEFLNQDKEARKLYEMREMALKDELNMIEGAKAEGERQKAKEVAKNLLAMDMTVEMVAKATGLPTEEIEKLKQQLH
ncbi:Rpn family recombination-promoting nuclease/putative transposase [Brevibacillus invocatus]|uniref:Rpn family recombination-promoting nuclease/putative transposase n=3 Tax=Brevibacillus invocatus TaxID=173959 RepID=A0A3M8CJT8_9BACL|nr:Rpn family recombination-promoting nuclease/putative transposase [Brevibacillus invocatus]